MITTPDRTSFAALPASDHVREVFSASADRLFELHVSRHGHEIVSRINCSLLDRVKSRRQPERRRTSITPPLGERRRASGLASDATALRAQSAR
jgi:hypothetical protein